MKSTSKRTSTKSVNGVKVTTTVVEETTTHPDGRREKVITETIEQGGKTTTNVTKSTEQGPPQDQPSISSGAGQRFPTKASQGNQTLDESNEDALKAHNDLRAQHGVPPLTLAKDLIDYAQKWAEHMASTGSFNHSNCTLNGQRLGENIAYTGSSAPTDYAGKDYTQSWYSEIKDHNFSKDHQGGTGHFTQVVWKGTKEVGFGKAKSADGRKVYVCGSYRPPGNMLGDFKSNVFPLKK